MSGMDDKIREALVKEEDTWIDEPGFFEQVGSTFRSRQRWLVVLVWFWSLAFFILAVVCAFRFFDAEGVRGHVLWATVFLYSMLAVGLLKNWYWMLMNRNTLAREIKRLELQIASMREELAERAG